VWALIAAAGFLAIALGIRATTGAWHGDGRWAQYSGTALYASMVYAGVLFIRPRIAPSWAGTIAVAFCWAVEAAQVTGIPAALSARSLLARVVLGVEFDWTDMLWYPVGIVPLVVIDRLLSARRSLGRPSTGDGSDSPRPGDTRVGRLGR
jgi:hypothetical protein